MDRRHFTRLSPLAALGLASVWANTSSAAKTPAPAKPSDHLHHHGAAASGASTAEAPTHEGCMPRRYNAIVAPFQACTSAAAVCISHCQVLLAQGDKAMAECLRTALDCDVVCNAALKAANLNSDFTPALLKPSIEAMQACVKACHPHVDHHAECRACHDACLSAIAAARKLG
ncbi:MAG: hypothetical protein RI907_3734 [Pseudomonadota bacterium]|jgi:Cys-rich four helix bundle protein (predicted Tat secretion target)